MPTVLHLSRESGIFQVEFDLSIPGPIVLTTFSGHVVNAIVKKILSAEAEDPTRLFMSSSPLYDRLKGRYVLNSGTATLMPGPYSFRVATTEPNAVQQLAMADSVEIEGTRSPVHRIAVTRRSLDALAKEPYPRRVEIEFLTPTNWRKPPKIGRGVAFELQVVPKTMFGNLAKTWNGIAGREELGEDFLNWVESYVHTAVPFELKSKVVALGRKREIPGLVGRACLELMIPKSSEAHYFRVTAVALLRMAELVQMGAHRRLGFGVVSIKEQVSAQ